MIYDFFEPTSAIMIQIDDEINSTERSRLHFKNNFCNYTISLRTHFER